MKKRLASGKLTFFVIPGEKGAVPVPVVLPY